MTQETSKNTAQTSRRVLVLGATGTIGRATTAALVRHGYDVTCVVRETVDPQRASADLAGVTVVRADVTHAEGVRNIMVNDARFDAVISCMSSRNGAPRDAWAIDHQATVQAIKVAKDAGVMQFVLLSAICVQKPRLAFQHAKLAAEQALVASGLTYSIVRPTA